MSVRPTGYQAAASFPEGGGGSEGGCKRNTFTDAGKLTGWAAVSASTLKVCFSMKEERSNPQRCAAEALPAHMVVGRRVRACVRAWAQSVAKPHSVEMSKTAARFSPVVRFPFPSLSLSPPPLLTLCLCAHPLLLLLLCSSSHTRVIPIPPTLLWAEARSSVAGEGDSCPFRNARWLKLNAF